MNNTLECKAPCIVNTAYGFHVFFCEKERVHKDDHFHEVLDVVDNIMGTLTWRYLGKAEHGDSWVRPLSERCDVWIHPAYPPKLVNEDQTRGILLYPLITIQNPADNTVIGFCCGKSPRHAGRHTRSGVFGPLGIKWEIVW